MKKKIAFVWQGISGRYGHWKDGLWRAMKYLEEKYEVTYHEPQDEIPSDAIVLYWESPVTIQGGDQANYKRIMNLDNKKALLFAGGPLKKEWTYKFDHIFVESKVNADECELQGIPYSVAFGINEEIMVPKALEKKYLGMHHGTCASWKRQWLVGEALREKGLVVGRGQLSDAYPFNRCTELGCTVMNEQAPEAICDLLNESWVCLQTSDYWGGGQRCTLEALACNVPVVCMSDSPKNREYVEESGCGLVTEPNASDISTAVTVARSTDYGTKGRDYVMSKWTARHYADSLSAWIDKQ